MEISDLIKSARIEKGLTQQQLADVAPASARPRASRPRRS